jgi:hypothetical protein
VPLLASSSIVILGNFNPAIFHPEWLGRYGILPAQEIQAAEGQIPKLMKIQREGTELVIEEVPPLIVQPEVASLVFPSLRIFVEPRKYQCSTTQRQRFSLCRDVTAKVFSILKHTPISAFGFNFAGHWRFEVSGEEKLRSILSNASLSEALGDDYKVGGTITLPGENRLVVIKLEESKPFEGGVYFSVNVQRAVESGQAEDAVDLIAGEYDGDLEHSIEIMKRLLGEPKDTYAP